MTGPMETIGLDGQITTTSASAMASRTPGAGRARSAPAKRTLFTSTLWRRPDEVLLEPDLDPARPVESARPAAFHWLPAPGRLPDRLPSPGASRRHAPWPAPEVANLIAEGDRDPGLDPAVRHGEQTSLHAEAPGHFRRHLRQGGPAGQPAGPEQVGGQVPVSQVEPGQAGRLRPATPRSARRASITAHDSPARPQPVLVVGAPPRV